MTRRTAPDRQRNQEKHAAEDTIPNPLHPFISTFRPEDEDGGPTSPWKRVGGLFLRLRLQVELRGKCGPTKTTQELSVGAVCSVGTESAQ